MIGLDNRQSSKNNNKYQLLYTYGCTSWWWAWATDSHIKRIISTNFCIHTVVAPDDGPRYAWNVWGLTKYTKLPVVHQVCFSLRNYIDLHGQPNTEKRVFFSDYLQIWAVFIPCCFVVVLCPIPVVYSFVSTSLLYNIGLKCVIKVLLHKKIGLCSLFIRAERRSHQAHNIQIKATLREGWLNFFSLYQIKFRSL